MIEGYATLASPENMRATARAMATKGSRKPSQTAPSNAPLPRQRIWSSHHGIVFAQRAIPSQYRGLGTLAAEERDGCLRHSHGEDNYVMALADTTALERQSPVTAKVPVAADTEAIPPKVPADSTAEDSCPMDPASPLPPAKCLEEPQPVDPIQNELPETSTSYKMTEELFRAAKNAESGTPGAYWSHALYRSPEFDGKSNRPTVHYCRSLNTTERVLKSYFMDKKVIGFDIEWKPEAYKNMGARSNVSLIQIACEDRIALFHLALYHKGDKIEDLVAPTLKKIMEDPEVTKIGVSIKADCTRVRKFLKIDSHGLFELSHLYKLVKFSESKDFTKINKKLVSLASQVQEHLHLPMYKGDGIRTSDWSKPLSLAQISYAAADSYAGLQLYHTLELKREALDPMPPRPYHADLNKPIRLADGLEISVEGEAEEVVPEEAEPSRTKRNYTKLTAKDIAAETESIEVEGPDGEYVPSVESSVGYPSFPPQP